MKSTTGDCEINLRLLSVDLKNVTKQCCEDDFDHEVEDFVDYDLNDREDLEMEVIRLEDIAADALILIEPTKRVLSCAFFQCEDSEDCFDTLNGPKCSCKPGFEEIEGNCQDIDECALGCHKCLDEHKHCINTQGSFECRGCVSGFTKVPNYFDEDGDDLCFDSNECQYDVCGKNEVCTNVEGSYRCTNISCPLGYVSFNNT